MFNSSPRRALAAALLCAAAVLAPAPAGAAPSHSPPSHAALERGTARVLERPAFDPPAALRAPGQRGEVRFPDDLYVTLYGAPQLINTVLGQLKPKRAARQAERRARDYERAGDAEAVPGFDLIGVVANSTPGPDRKYRTRQPDEIIETYLDAIRAVDGRLMLDIQPGRSTAIRETKALADWVAEPDVDIGIDPEWNVGPKGVPGQTTGSISAAEINAVSRHLDRIVRREDLPPKVLIIHQFTKKMIDNRRSIEQRDGVQVLLNFDGIGSPAAKEAGYAALATRGLFNGFSIFLSLDTKVMSPGTVLDLVPAVNFLLYQ